MELRLRPSLILTLIGFLLCTVFLVNLLHANIDWEDVAGAGTLQFFGLLALFAAMIANIIESVVRS